MILLQRRLPLDLRIPLRGILLSCPLHEYYLSFRPDRWIFFIVKVSPQAWRGEGSTLDVLWEELCYSFLDGLSDKSLHGSAVNCGCFFQILMQRFRYLSNHFLLGFGQLIERFSLHFSLSRDDYVLTFWHLRCNLNHMISKRVMSRNRRWFSE